MRGGLADRPIDRCTQARSPEWRRSWRCDERCLPRYGRLVSGRPSRRLRPPTASLARRLAPLPRVAKRRRGGVVDFARLAPAWAAALRFRASWIKSAGAMRAGHVTGLPLALLGGRAHGLNGLDGPDGLRTAKRCSCNGRLASTPRAHQPPPSRQPFEHRETRTESRPFRSRSYHGPISAHPAHLGAFGPSRRIRPISAHSAHLGASGPSRPMRPMRPMRPTKAHRIMIRAARGSRARALPHRPQSSRIAAITRRSLSPQQHRRPDAVRGEASHATRQRRPRPTCAVMLRR
jgi:hypothetical protein